MITFAYRDIMADPSKGVGFVLDESQNRGILRAGGMAIPAGQTANEAITENITRGDFIQVATHDGDDLQTTWHPYSLRGATNFNVTGITSENQQGANARGIAETVIWINYPTHPESWNNHPNLFNLFAMKQVNDKNDNARGIAKASGAPFYTNGTNALTGAVLPPAQKQDFLISGEPAPLIDWQSWKVKAGAVLLALVFIAIVYKKMIA